MKFFNTAGPINQDDHYHIDPLTRLDTEQVMMLVAQKKYFLLHAPRQVGKTSYLLALMDALNKTGQYHALYINVEVGQSAREDRSSAMGAILNELALNAEIYLDDSYPRSIWQEIARQENSGGYGLNAILTQWARENEKPIVLLIDEVDSLVGDTLISVLRQIRAGYTQRPRSFPQSVVLCGVRDVRDYRLIDKDGKSVITGGSAFNIKAESWRMGNFDKDEVARLYQQHTDETGQPFEPAAIERAWDYTDGQPWLVNALGYEVCFKMKGGRNRDVVITAGMIDEAKERLIVRRETHIDQLADKLKEGRVRRVIAPMLEGESQQFNPHDVEYVIDLGLIKRARNGALSLANKIYQEVIPRELTFGAQMGIWQETAWYVEEDGRLNMPKLLEAFQQFFRENSESWIERFDYKEAGPHLLMQAFLQRIINGGGTIGREYALGRKRTDLLVMWTHPAGVQRVAIELKIMRSSWERTLAEALPQTWEYMDMSGAEAAHLVMFDRRVDVSWDDKIKRLMETVNGVSIEVWGM